MRVETELIHRSLGNESDNNKSGFKAEWRTWKKLFSEKYRDRTMIGLLVMVFQRTSFPHVIYLHLSMNGILFWFISLEWSGINALLYYGPTIVRSIGLGGDTVTLVVSGGISVVQFLACLPSIVLIDRLGGSFLSYPFWF